MVWPEGLSEAGEVAGMALERSRSQSSGNLAEAASTAAIRQRCAKTGSLKLDACLAISVKSSARLLGMRVYFRVR